MSFLLTKMIGYNVAFWIHRNDWTVLIAEPWFTSGLSTWRSPIWLLFGTITWQEEEVLLRLPRFVTSAGCSRRSLQSCLGWAVHWREGTGSHAQWEKNWSIQDRIPTICSLCYRDRCHQGHSHCLSNLFKNKSTMWEGMFRLYDSYHAQPVTFKVMNRDVSSQTIAKCLLTVSALEHLDKRSSPTVCLQFLVLNTSVVIQRQQCSTSLHHGLWVGVVLLGLLLTFLWKLEQAKDRAVLSACHPDKQQIFNFTSLSYMMPFQD